MKSLFLTLGGLACLLGISFPTLAQIEGVVDPEVVISSQNTTQRTLKRKVAIGRFSNETQYSKGIFYDRENDPMAKQALDILSTKLNASGKFLLLERDDLDKLDTELKNIGGGERIGADYLILGSITEFGRKTMGENGILTTKKTQMVEAGVSIRIVDVSTGLVIFSEEGKGSAETTAESTLGYGGKAGYDASLSDKAISAAMDMLVENIINKMSDKPWRTYFLSYDNDGIFIAGGTSQGLRQGDTFDVYLKGKRVKNPQTGVTVELPGKKVASIIIDMVGGETPETEYSLVSQTSGKVDASRLEDYYIEQSE